MIFNYSINRNINSGIKGTHTVAVIATFATDGRFQPLYFRYVANDATEHTYQIKAIKSTKDKENCKVFHSLITEQDINYQVNLTFYIKECMWVLEV